MKAFFKLLSVIKSDQYFPTHEEPMAVDSTTQGTVDKVYLFGDSPWQS